MADNKNWGGLMSGKPFETKKFSDLPADHQARVDIAVEQERQKLISTADSELDKVERDLKKLLGENPDKYRDQVRAIFSNSSRDLLEAYIARGNKTEPPESKYDSIMLPYQKAEIDKLARRHVEAKMPELAGQAKTNAIVSMREKIAGMGEVERWDFVAELEKNDPPFKVPQGIEGLPPETRRALNEIKERSRKANEEIMGKPPVLPQIKPPVRKSRTSPD